MYWDVVEAKPLAHLTLLVRFADGLSGAVHLRRSALRGVLEPLADPAFFALVQVSEGFVAWPGEIDLAPDAMHSAILAHGECVLE